MITLSKSKNNLLLISSIKIDASQISGLFLGTGFWICAFIEYTSSVQWHIFLI